MPHQRLGDDHFPGHIDQVIQLGGVHLDGHRLATARRWLARRGLCRVRLTFDCGSQGCEVVPAGFTGVFLQ